MRAIWCDARLNNIIEKDSERRSKGGEGDIFYMNRFHDCEQKKSPCPESEMSFSSPPRLGWTISPPPFALGRRASIGGRASGPPSPSDYSNRGCRSSDC